MRRLFVLLLLLVLPVGASEVSVGVFYGPEGYEGSLVQLGYTLNLADFPIDLQVASHWGEGSRDVVIGARTTLLQPMGFMAYREFSSEAFHLLRGDEVGRAWAASRMRLVLPFALLDIEGRYLGSGYPTSLLPRPVETVEDLGVGHIPGWGLGISGRYLSTPPWSWMGMVDGVIGQIRVGAGVRHQDLFGAPGDLGLVAQVGVVNQIDVVTGFSQELTPGVDLYLRTGIGQDFLDWAKPNPAWVGGRLTVDLSYFYIEDYLPSLPILLTIEGERRGGLYWRWTQGEIGEFWQIRSSLSYQF